MRGVENKVELLDEATRFINEAYVELGKENLIEQRLAVIAREIEEKNSYEHTLEEIERGARMAWRNNNRCIGRLFWQQLQIRDARTVHTTEEIKQTLFNHIEEGTNNGAIRPTLTVFKPNTVKIWNEQLIRYAGYIVDGQQIGDPLSNEITALCQRLGWKSPQTDFDVLPLLFQKDETSPMTMQSIPSNLVKEVEITHPDYPKLAELGLKWYAIPVITNMRLEIGGISYDAAPFNGWYMGTEIASRNFVDEQRYNKLDEIAAAFDITTRKNRDLWKDRTLLELNIALLQSYQREKVQVVDHHTAAKQFGQFEQQEKAQNRKVTGNWAWLIPPMSPTTTHIFHQRYNNEVKKPNFFYKKSPFDKGNGCPFHQ
ncbi:nitric oxide synthase [Brochothrix thermosphacta]|nr:nitric oxide synthase [Brochothrix thermosphacta]ODJ70803.1 nitric oxide synthase [Brochothrix thermosphacta]